MIAIENVQNKTPTVNVGAKITLTFEVTGASKYFTFPFTNNSLTEKKIVFIPITQ